MSTFTKEQLIEKLQHRISVASGFPESEKAQMDLELARIALASLEAEAVGFIARHKETGKFGSYLHPKADWFKNDDYEVLSAYTAPPAPVSVPDEMTPEMMRAVRLNSELGAYAIANLSDAYGLCDEFWKVACRAAMLQGGKS
ncbi:Uncharacterised protein [Enterobacter ludwigii]|uniref:hypothetical protein n=1 Tax=Enterobacter TaxID=547 RepID=UPI00079811B4|nr:MULTISPECIES: hypothetical protein [Enterobacter]QLW26136.1 hypothetical protein HV189_10760 [Enterobacter sp. RHBSTW-00422]SAG44822.1 Uncharacterised protein [Enterobacter ludwigii]